MTAGLGPCGDPRAGAHGDFFAALERRDLDAATDLMAADVRYQNVPWPATRGLRSTRRLLGLLQGCTSGVTIDIRHLAVDGQCVLTERNDTVRIGRVEIRFWACGTFDVRDGRIHLWRDRFDHLGLLVAILTGLMRALGPRRSG